MPDRVKCLHVLVGHSLAAGPGVNPLGDEAIAMLPEWWRKGPCVAAGRRPDRPTARLDAEEPMTRVAAIDCGTNSIRLLVADVDPATGRLTDLDRRMTIVRLGQGVDRTGRLAPEALERTFAACREYAGCHRRARRASGCGSWPPPPRATRRTATSSSTGCGEILGVEPEVITGDAGGGALLHGRHQGTGGASGPASGRSWWSTSAAAPPSSCSATTRCAPRGRWTSAACG